MTSVFWDSLTRSRIDNMANGGLNQQPYGDTSLALKGLRRKSFRRQPSRQPSMRLREPSFAINRRGRLLPVKLAFDRSSRILADATYRKVVSRCRKEHKEPTAGLRRAHRLFWNALLLRVFTGVVFERIAGRLRCRWLRLTERLENEAARPDHNRSGRGSTLAELVDDNSGS